MRDVFANTCVIDVFLHVGDNESRKTNVINNWVSLTLPIVELTYRMFNVLDFVTHVVVFACCFIAVNLCGN